MNRVDKLQEKMSSKPVYGKGMNLKDNTHASSVKAINTMSEKYDMGKMQEYSCGSKGYPKEAAQMGKVKY